MYTLKPPRLTLPKLTDRLTLGEDGLRVSPFCLGLVGSDDTACAAFDSGINFFFLSADLHWPLYESARLGLEKLLARGRCELCDAAGILRGSSGRRSDGSTWFGYHRPGDHRRGIFT